MLVLRLKSFKQLNMFVVWKDTVVWQNEKAKNFRK